MKVYFFIIIMFFCGCTTKNVTENVTVLQVQPIATAQKIEDLKEDAYDIANDPSLNDEEKSEKLTPLFLLIQDLHAMQIQMHDKFVKDMINYIDPRIVAKSAIDLREELKDKKEKLRRYRAQAHSDDKVISNLEKIIRSREAWIQILESAGYDKFRLENY